ncbi:hypothetical protein PC128_g26860 [Phytophthora cactorum]|nr:hypothetical protein PC128_g26860 [Phytophthora cactorum]
MGRPRGERPGSARAPFPAPPDVKSDREHLFKAAHDRSLPVERIQYPWEGQRLFYDPDKLPNLYMAH